MNSNDLQQFQRQMALISQTICSIFTSSAYTTAQGASHMSSKQRMKDVLVQLRQAGFTGKFTMSYNGSGDSGDVEPPDYRDTEGKPQPGLKGAIEALGVIDEYDSGDPTKISVYEVAGDVLPGGWEINEGSSGEIVFDIDKCTITVCHNENVTSTEYSEYEV